MARTVKLPGTEVHVTSLKPAAGAFTYIEYRSYEAVVSTGIVRVARAAAAEGFDALAIGCFYDTALHEAREVSGEMVVTAPCAASLEIAASLANRFGIIVGRRKWVHQMNATVRDNGMAERLSGFYPVELGVTDFQTDHAATERLLTAAGRKAIEEDYAEAIILGCTLEIGLHDRLAQACVPVIDPSIRLAEARRVRRGTEAQVRLETEPPLVLRAPTGSRDRRLRDHQRRRRVREPGRGGSRVAGALIHHAARLQLGLRDDTLYGPTTRRSITVASCTCIEWAPLL